MGHVPSVTLLQNQISLDDQITTNYPTDHKAQAQAGPEIG